MKTTRRNQLDALISTAMSAVEEIKKLESDVNVGLNRYVTTIRTNLLAITAIKLPDDLTKEFEQAISSANKDSPNRLFFLYFEPVQVALLALQGEKQMGKPENDIQRATENLCIATNSFIARLLSEASCGSPPNPEDTKHVLILLKIVNKAVRHDTKLHRKMQRNIDTLNQQIATA
ncbi:hypothetical protein KKF55_03670 [Patescibacteria group bacterium]|nr:hypothetical protein [Patescibacteria group bacterium]